MYYVNPNEVLRIFEIYIDGHIEDHGEMLSKGAVIEELRDALDDVADVEWIDKDGE